MTDAPEIADHERGHLTEEDSADVVIGRNAGAADARLAEIMAILTRHLHAAVKEIEPSEAEWLSGIGFLTETGHLCTDWRQEFILLSDTLGVSMLVDAINNRKPSGASESTVLGPFHVPDAPEMSMGSDICLDRKGEPKLVRGRIRAADGTPIEGCKLDVWQANDEGFYDVQQKGLQPEFNLRGVFRTDADGSYHFRCVKPKYYPIPDDGTVGRMLAALGRHPFRPAHLHYILTADGFDGLTTHIFDGNPTIRRSRSPSRSRSRARRRPSRQEPPSRTATSGTTTAHPADTPSGSRPSRTASSGIARA